MALKALASLLLLLVIIARIPAVFWPKKVKKQLNDLFKISRDWRYALSFALLATGLILVATAARLTSLGVVVVTAFGVGLLAGSFLVYNDLHKDMLKAFTKRPDKWLQKVAVVKIAIAAVLLYIISSSASL